MDEKAKTEGGMYLLGNLEYRSYTVPAALLFVSTTKNERSREGGGGGGGI